MDDEGWIPLAVVANFNRVRMLTTDMVLIADALRDSEVVEVRMEGCCSRCCCCSCNVRM